METRFLIERPSEVECTFKITMQLKDWEKLRDQLGEGYPAWELTTQITQCLAQARKIFYPKEKP